MNYHWPGNVRELENTVELTLILNRGNILDFTDLGKGEKGSSLPDIAAPADLPVSGSLDGIIIGQIEKVLKMVSGKVYGPGGAAELLKVNPSTLRNPVRKMGIPFGRNVDH